MLDLSGVGYLSSAGLRVSLTTARHCQRAGGQMALAAAPPAVQQVLHLAHLSEIIPIFETVARAADSFREGPAAPLPEPAALSFAEEIYRLALDLIGKTVSQAIRRIERVIENPSSMPLG